MPKRNETELSHWQFLSTQQFTIILIIIIINVIIFIIIIMSLFDCKQTQKRIFRPDFFVTAATVCLLITAGTYYSLDVFTAVDYCVPFTGVERKLMQKQCYNNDNGL